MTKSYVNNMDPQVDHPKVDRLQQFEERPKSNIDAVQYGETNGAYIRALVDGYLYQPADGRPPRICFSNGAYPHGTFIVMDEWLIRGDDCLFRVMEDHFFRETYQEVDD